MAYSLSGAMQTRWAHKKALVLVYVFTQQGMQEREPRSLNNTTSRYERVESLVFSAKMYAHLRRSLTLVACSITLVACGLTWATCDCESVQITSSARGGEERLQVLLQKLENQKLSSLLVSLTGLVCTRVLFCRKVK